MATTPTPLMPTSVTPAEPLAVARGLIAAVADAAEGERHTTLYWAIRRAAEEGLLDGSHGLQTAFADAARDAGLFPDEIENTITDAIATARAVGGR